MRYLPKTSVASANAYPQHENLPVINDTIKDATVKRYFFGYHDRLRNHLSDFLDAYNYARRLKRLSGLTPYEYICKIRTS